MRCHLAPLGPWVGLARYSCSDAQDKTPKQAEPRPNRAGQKLWGRHCIGRLVNRWLHRRQNRNIRNTVLHKPRPTPEARCVDDDESLGWYEGFGG